MCGKHDESLLRILKEENNIVSFLDSVFDFLYRCTDFYHQQPYFNNQGNPMEMAEDLVHKIFKKYKLQATYDEQNAAQYNLATTDDKIPAACQEIILDNNQDCHETEILPIHNSKEQTSKALVNVNGDDLGDYRWTQTISDVDISIPVPESLSKANQVRIEIDVHHLNVEILKEKNWEVILKKLFLHDIIPQDSFWSLVPGLHLQVNVEKREKRWWDRLFVSDPPIDVSKIETSIELSELTECDRKKIEEIILSGET